MKKSGETLTSSSRKMSRSASLYFRRTNSIMKTNCFVMSVATNSLSSCVTVSGRPTSRRNSLSSGCGAGVNTSKRDLLKPCAAATVFRLLREKGGGRWVD